MGLVVFAAIAVYLIVLITVTRLAYRSAAKRGLPRGKRWQTAAGGFLLVYLPVFWDHIPTIVAHKYYCEKEAGFWVYKTLEQWKRENPGVLDALVNSKGAPSRYERYDDGRGKIDTYLLNERFNWIVSQQDISSFLPIIRTEQQVKDVKKNELLARYVDFATGNSVKYTVGPPGPLKFWMSYQHCGGGEYNQGSLYTFEHNIRGVEK
jgi:hypothetical protein